MKLSQPTRRGYPRGFTLLELLVVVLIIGLLTAIVGPRLSAQIGRSEMTAARAQMDALAKALQAYRIDGVAIVRKAGRAVMRTSGLERHE